MDRINKEYIGSISTVSSSPLWFENSILRLKQLYSDTSLSGNDNVSWFNNSMDKLKTIYNSPK
jgi:hypothetical protein